MGAAGEQQAGEGEDEIGGEEEIEEGGGAPLVERRGKEGGQAAVLDGHSCESDCNDQHQEMCGEGLRTGEKVCCKRVEKEVAG